MAGYLLRRLGQMVPVFILISIIMFAMIRTAPGDPARLLISPEHTNATSLAIVHAELGLNDPAPVQYVRMMGSLLDGRLLSFTTRQPVFAVIAARLPTTLSLSLASLIFGVVVGILVGLGQAMRPYTRLDDAGTAVSLLGYSIPEFWFGIMLILLFAVVLHWFPAGGIRSPTATGWNPLDVMWHLVLPVIVLGTGLMAVVARYTRSAMLDALSQDFIRTARAKGVRERSVIAIHALRNSLLPIITLLGFYLPFLLGGDVIVEEIFALPGVGRLLVDSVFARDYPVVLTINLLGAITVLLGNFLADLSYTWADPRVRLG